MGLAASQHRLIKMLRDRGELEKEIRYLQSGLSAIDRKLGEVPLSAGHAEMVAQLGAGLDRLRARLRELDEGLSRDAKAGKASSTRRFWWGVLLGLPVGVVGSYLASALGLA
jgi:hypothetical protein